MQKFQTGLCAMRRMREKQPRTLQFRRSPCQRREPSCHPERSAPGVAGSLLLGWRGAQSKDLSDLYLNQPGWPLSNHLTLECLSGPLTQTPWEVMRRGLAQLRGLQGPLLPGPYKTWRSSFGGGISSMGKKKIGAGDCKISLSKAPSPDLRCF